MIVSSQEFLKFSHKQQYYYCYAFLMKFYNDRDSYEEEREILLNLMMVMDSWGYESMQTDQLFWIYSSIYMHEKNYRSDFESILLALKYLQMKQNMKSTFKNIVF